MLIEVVGFTVLLIGILAKKIVILFIFKLHFLGLVPQLLIYLFRHLLIQIQQLLSIKCIGTYSFNQEDSQPTNQHNSGAQNQKKNC